VQVTEVVVVGVVDVDEGEVDELDEVPPDDVVAR